MKTIEIKVENLKCGGCGSTIKKGLLKFDEVETVNVDTEKSIITINYNGEEKEQEKYIQKMASLGYPQAEDNNIISKAKSYVSCAIGRMNK